LTTKWGLKVFSKANPLNILTKVLFVQAIGPCLCLLVMRIKVLIQIRKNILLVFLFENSVLFSEKYRGPLSDSRRDSIPLFQSLLQTGKNVLFC
jgi:hypothetical protein